MVGFMGEGEPLSNKEIWHYAIGFSHWIKSDLDIA